MDVYALKQHIIKDESKIALILEKVGFSSISDSFSRGEEYRCAWEDGSNPTSVRVRKDNLSANYFSKGINGDIVTLVQEKLNISFPKALREIAGIVGFQNVEVRNDIELPFGGFYKKIHKIKKREFVELESYDESLLDEYMVMPSKMFLEDGIDCIIQEQYNILYDVMTNRIGVPWRSTSGELVGIMGRLNKHEIEEYESKWLPILAFQKSKAIFGFSENYKSIQNEGLLFLNESEKASMQLSSKGINLGLSLGGSSMSQFQANNIKSLFTKRIIVMLDEGLDEQVSIDMAKQLEQKDIFKNEVLYVYDRENKYLPKGSKMSPSDLPKDELRKIITECCRKI